MITVSGSLPDTTDAQPHAVKQIGSNDYYCYDANGIRTKTVRPGGITTYFPFPGYEETVNGASTIKRSSYSLAGQTIAMRVTGDPVSGNNGLFYVLSDHLGSTSVLSNSSGSLVAGSTTRYLPFGGYRGTAPTQTITDRDFTGQKENRELELLYYNARFYVPSIGKFASADTIVPDPVNPQGWNRYSYTINNPVKYIDPSGHCWGVASGLRNTFYGTTCNNLDMAITIVTSPDASVGEKVIAGGYIVVQGAAHACVAFCVPGAILIESAAATAVATTVGTAVCTNDGDCSNEVVAATNGVSSAANAIMADGNPTNEAQLGLEAFSRASEFGIKTFNQLGRLTRGTGLERHHIVEQRFADTLGITKPGNMPSIALTPKEHQVFTNAWREAIAYSNSSILPNTVSASVDDIWQAAQDIYSKYPVLTEAARKTIFE